jgi:hypothetical protein
MPVLQLPSWISPLMGRAQEELPDPRSQIDQRTFNFGLSLASYSSRDVTKRKRGLSPRLNEEMSRSSPGLPSGRAEPAPPGGLAHYGWLTEENLGTT